MLKHVAPRDAAVLRATMDSCLRTGVAFELEYAVAAANGSEPRIVVVHGSRTENGPADGCSAAGGCWVPVRTSPSGSTHAYIPKPLELRQFYRTIDQLLNW